MYSGYVLNPRWGTAIRTHCTFTIQSFYSDSEKQVVEMKEKVVDNVKDVKESTGKIDDLVPAEIKEQRESWRERLKHVDPKAKLKLVLQVRHRFS